MKKIKFTSLSEFEKSNKSESAKCSAINIETGEKASSENHNTYSANRKEVINKLS